MRKADLCSSLKKSILTLELGPGLALDEARLSEEFGLSRTPLREVFRRLAGEGYVELHENRGAGFRDDAIVAARSLSGGTDGLWRSHAAGGPKCDA